MPYHDPTTGRTLRKRLTTTKREWEDAHDWLVEKQSERKRNLHRSTEDPYLHDFLEGWLRDVIAPSVAPKTLEKRQYHAYNHIIPALGQYRLTKLQPRDLHLFYLDLARGGRLSLSTRRAIHTTLKMALNQAVRWSLIAQNPLELVDPPKESAPVAERIRAFTDEQARALFDAMDDRWRGYVIFAVRTGLRPGEALGLRWQDVEWGDPASIKVRQVLALRSGRGRAKGESQFYFKAPKSKASRRTVVLHHEALEALEAQRTMLEDEGLPCGPGDLVFPSTTGTPMDRGNLLQRHVAPAMARAGIPALTLHELRHTFASVMLYEWRVPLEVVSAMLGHKDVSLTLRIYGHLVPGSQESAIRALRSLQGGERVQLKQSSGG